MKLFSMTRALIALSFSMFALILPSCQKENNSSEEITEEQAAVYSDESAQAEASFDDVEDISKTAADEEALVSAPNGRIFPFAELRLRIGACATITVSPDDSTYPKTITIDFGDGCVCADGKFRKGIILVHLTGPIRRSGSVMTITLQNFYLNRARIEGTKTVSNVSANGNIKFTVQVNDGKVTLPTGRGYSYESIKYVHQVEGGTTATLQDDIYHLEGRSVTHFNNGVTITLNTETPLVKKLICPWISDGTLKIKINSRVLFLNYGAPSNGDCDNKALLTWNDGANQRLITLP